MSQRAGRQPGQWYPQQQQPMHLDYQWQQPGVAPPWKQAGGPSVPMGSQMMYPPPYKPPLPPQYPMRPSGESPAWGAPPQFQGGYGGQGCCDAPWCGAPGQPGPCDCCFAPSGGGCCLCCNNGPLDPYCCGPPTGPSCTSCMKSFCDWTYCTMAFFVMVSVFGFIIMILFSASDDIFKRFRAQDISSLQDVIQNNIVEGDVCGSTNVFGLSGTVFLNETLDARVLTVQISSWTTQRNTLYLIAFIFTVTTFVYATLVALQRNKIFLMPGVGDSYDQQEEQGTQQQQQQQQGRKQNQPKNAGMQSGKKIDGRGRTATPRNQRQEQKGKQLPPPLLCTLRRPIEVYGTPFYEFMRVAWFVMGVAVVFWTFNLLVSFWDFSTCYRLSTRDELKDFFDGFHFRFVASVICVTIYLAWPLVNIFVEFVLWLVLILPWIIFRSICKQGIGNLRPALPLDEMPGFIRLDMFFMDFGDLSRLGFSEPTWKLLTGSTTPLVSCCEDPSIDRDPNMSSLQQKQYEWYSRMHGMYPMGMGMQPPCSPGSFSPSTNPATPAGHTTNAHDESSRQQRRHRSRTHDHHRDSVADAGAPVQWNADDIDLYPPKTGGGASRQASGHASDDDDGVDSSRQSQQRTSERHGSRTRHRHRSRDDDGHRSREHDGHRSRDDDGHRSREHDGHRSRDDNGHRSREHDGHRSREHDGHRSREHDGHRSRDDDGHRSREHDGHRSRGRRRGSPRRRDAEADGESGGGSRSRSRHHRHSERSPGNRANGENSNSSGGNVNRINNAELDRMLEEL